MEEQKKEIVALVRVQKPQGQSITESLKELGIKGSTYYSWRKPRKHKETGSAMRALTPYERQAIEETKERSPHLRHRQVQWIL